MAERALFGIVYVSFTVGGILAFMFNILHARPFALSIEA